MTFKEIQDDVLLDRFDETQRGAVKSAINSRYGRMWAVEPWTFKRALVSHNLSADDDSFTLADVGLQKVESIHSNLPSDFSRWYSDRPEMALDWASENAGISNAFTVIGNTVRLDRPLSSGAAIWILGQLKWERLVDDNDVPLIPEEYHGALVQGAASDMLLREADPTWQGEEKMYQEQVAEMRLSYLSNQPLARTAYPSWPY
jgi:hypothetical protein